LLINRNADDTNSIIKLLNTVHPLSTGSYTNDDAQLFTKISIAVSTRSASLVAASTIALLQVNNELCKVPERSGGSWTCGSTSSGTPSPSDSGLGSMDDDSRWPPSRRGSLFSAPGSRRGSLASPLSVQPKAVIPEGVVGTLIRENGLVTEDPAEMSDDDDDIVVVAFCGSVMEKYHTFRERCQKILDELVQQPCPTSAARVNGAQQGPFGVAGLQLTEQRRVVLEENSDGGILGAGILAAVVDTRELSSSVAGMATAK
jgi:Hexokinase